jgi:uncharacterized membrane protein
MTNTIDGFTWTIIAFAILLIAATSWIYLSHVGVDYTQCNGKSCLTNADLIGGGFIKLTLPIFVILVIIKVIILGIQIARRKMPQ